MTKPAKIADASTNISTNEREFSKKNKTVPLISAGWKGLNGMPDHPQFWTHMLVKLKDGSRYLLSQKFVKRSNLNWGFEWCLAPSLLICPLDAVHACPTGVPSRPTPKATGQNLRKGTQTRYGAGVRTSQRRAADFGKESLRPKGGGALSAAR